ncbi:hypothetical protein [Actibacterium pelagium]|uniref:hypothetical protein n=1 Tax=Actibacterium pelagium TaxID=2029103 RepID=UPI001177DC97|nr:hypothetical protein [Actibacterium pelagium]
MAKTAGKTLKSDNQYIAVSWGKDGLSMPISWSALNLTADRGPKKRPRQSSAKVQQGGKEAA